jgi:hypothetical protein
MALDEQRTILVIANETVDGGPLTEALQWRAALARVRVIVVCPAARQAHGFVVYEEAQLAAARVRLERTLPALQKLGMPVLGVVVSADPVAAAADAVGRFAPDEILVSTHRRRASRWLRADVVEQIRRETGLPVEHVLPGDHDASTGARVLVVADRSVEPDSLVGPIRARARRSPARFLIVFPQEDPTQPWSPQTERRLGRTLRLLRSLGIDATGYVAHPDARLAALNAVHEQPTDEIIVSARADSGSGLLGRDIAARLRRATGLPVEQVGLAAAAYDTPTAA